MGRFVHLRSTGAEINNFNKNGQRTMLYDWRDLNGDRDYDPGEVNLDPNGPRFPIGRRAAQRVPEPGREYSERRRILDRFRAPVDIADRAVRVGGVYLKNFNVPPEPESAAALFGVQHSDLETRSRPGRQPQHVGRHRARPSPTGTIRRPTAERPSRASSWSTTTRSTTPAIRRSSSPPPSGCPMDGSSWARIRRRSATSRSSTVRR